MADITGTSGNDTLNGTPEDDTINTLEGRDSVNGLGGSDTLIVDYSATPVDPYAGASIANVPSEVSSNGGTFFGAIRTVDGGNYVNFSNIEHLVVQLDFFHNIFRVDGSALAQGASISVDGGAGNDTLEMDLSALASVDLEVGPGGITASFGTVLNFEIFKLDLTEAADNVTTGSGNDTLVGNGGDDVLDSAGGQDVLSGGAGTNSLTGGDGDDRITSEGIDTVNGGDGYDRWTGNYGASSENLTFVHNAGTGAGTLSNGTNLSGIEQVESLTTGSGNDVFTFTAGVGISVSAGTGADTLNLTGSGWSGTIEADGSAAFRGMLGYDRFSGIENLNFTSGGGDDSIAVSAAPLLAGATLSLNAAGGHDTLDMDFTGFGGISFVVSGGTVTTSVAATLSNFETYHIISGSGADTITTGGGADTITSGDGDDIAEGKGGADVIRTGGGNDWLDGGGGPDQMEGGGGNDTYIVDTISDVINESASSGTDLVISADSYALGAHVENLTLTGSVAVYGLGNGLANILTGNLRANTLDGGIGGDTMTGGLGNDIYVVDNALDKAIESAGGGTDTVQSSIGLILGDELENLTLTGSAAINGTGNALANIILGNTAANTLNGGAGNDTMQGGWGNDTYVVDSIGDKAIEEAGGGVDRVQSSVTFILGAEVENLTLTGAAAINGTGNAVANMLTGNGAANILDGKAGADIMQGGAGDDTYVVDDPGDLVSDSSATGGIDLVRSAVSFTLGVNLENLTLTGSAVINATGNALANIIVGNAGANLIDGKGGADTMTGGAGDDTYFIDNAGDVAIETNAAHGVDTVRSGLSYTLGANIENLVLTGPGAIDGTGSSANNILTGNGAANILSGLLGNDTLLGGGGADTLKGATGNDIMEGGTGADSFIFDSALNATTNLDHIVDFAHLADKLVLENARFSGLAAGALSASAFVVGTAAADASDRIIYDAATGALYFDKDGTGAAAQVQFATLDNMPVNLSASDFLVI